jgi:hypothetical protein
MKNVKISVGGAIEDEASRRFVDAWHRGARGERSRNVIWLSKAGTA